MTFYSSWPTTEGTRPTTLFQFVGETMHVTCARVSSGMASEGHSIGPQGDIYLAPTGPFVADNSQFAQQAGLVARVVMGWWRLSSSFTSLLAKESKGTILSGAECSTSNIKRISLRSESDRGEILLNIRSWSLVGEGLDRANRRWSGVPCCDAGGAS